MSMTRNVTLEEWLEEGKQKFGDEANFRFVCPICKHGQSVRDFEAFKAQGAKPDHAYKLCIGRFVGAKRQAFGGDGPGPCDYTSGRLFNLNPVLVTFTGDDGRPRTIAAFEFAGETPEVVGDALPSSPPPGMPEISDAEQAEAWTRLQAAIAAEAEVKE